MGDKIIRKISVIVSVYNEELSLPGFYGETKPVLESLDCDYELIFVNDGSRDKSLEMLIEMSEKDEKVKVIGLSKNFGHEAAMIAGIDNASGDGIICMDADLQHPPASIPDIIAEFNKGYEVVSMIRTSREDGGLIKKITSGLFYKILNMSSKDKFERNSSDFFGITANVADILRNDYRDKVRYLRGYVQSIGYKKTTLDFVAKKRHAGKSNYGIGKLLSFSINTLCSFSDFPLKLGLWTGGIAFIIGIILIIYTIICKAVIGTPSGYATIIAVMCFMFAVLLLVVGIIGQYISIIFKEVKDHPIYVIGRKFGFKDENNIE